MDARTSPLGIIHSIRETLEARAVWMAGAVLIATTLAGALSGYAPYLAAMAGYPPWLGLAAPLTGASVILFSLLRFDWAVFVAFASIGFVRVEPAPFDLLVLVLLALGLLTGRLRYPAFSSGPGVHLGLWGLGLITTLSATGVVPLGYSLRFLVITFYALALCIFVRMYAMTPDAARKVIDGYVLSASASVLLSIVGLLGIGAAPQWFTESGLRAKGFFKDSNVFAAFLVPAVFFMVDRAVRTKFSWAGTLPRIALACLLIIGTVLSFSRAAWGHLAISGLLYIVLLSWQAPRRQVISLSVWALIMLLLAGVVVQATGLTGFVLERWTLKSYDEQRFENQLRGVAEGLMHPIGVGPGRWPNAHSLYARTLAEHGLVGLGTLALLVIATLRGLVRRLKTESLHSQGLPARVLLPCIVGQLVNSVVIDSIHWRHMWVVFGLSWSALSVLEKEAE